MPRILGVTIPDQKRTEIALMHLYGVGRSLAQKVLLETSIPVTKRAQDLTPEELRRIAEFIQQHYAIEGDLRRERQMAIKRLKDIGSWRGLRHGRGLPVRGQHTRKNTRTVRGNVRRTTISGKRRTEKK